MIRIDDWAQYQYDIRGQEIYLRPLSGLYPKSIYKAGQFKLITKEAAKKQ